MLVNIFLPGKTSQVIFRGWLEEFAHRDERRERIEAVFEEMAAYNAGGQFAREMMNER